MSASPRDTRRGTRSYRSTRRPQPCDQCRERKSKCVILQGPLCERCRRGKESCSFTQRDPRRSVRSVASSAPCSTASSTHDMPIQQHQQGELTLQPPLNTSSREATIGGPVSPPNLDCFDTDPQIQIPGPSLLAESLPVRPLIQTVHSLEHLSGTTAIFLGTASSSDPWLLRHCKFDQSGLHSSGNLRFRNAGGLPTIGKVPVQFLVCPNNSAEPTAAVTQCPKEAHNRDMVERIVPIVQGQRLIRLYVRMCKACN